jgi:hypothetical protein
VWTVAAFLFYTVFGFFLLPPLVRVIAVRQLSKQLNRPVTIQKLRLNPYTFSATIGGLLIRDKDGTPLLSWDAAHVNFQLISLFSHAWVFKEIRVAQPFVRVQVNKDYTLNFADIVDKFTRATAAKPGETAKSHPWRIDRLRVSGGKLSFADLTPRIPFQRIVGPLELTVTNFQTASDHGNAFALSGLSDGGEQFSWKGSFRLAPFRSEGEFVLKGFALTTYAPLYQDLFRFEIKDGVVSLRSTYRYESSAATHLLAVTNATPTLSLGNPWSWFGKNLTTDCTDCTDKPEHKIRVISEIRGQISSHQTRRITSRSTCSCSSVNLVAASPRRVIRGRFLHISTSP